MQQKINVLMTGAGAPGAPGIIRCLQQERLFKIFAADADDEAVGKFLCDGFIQIPKANADNFVNTLLQICRQHNIHVLLPLVTKELFLLAANKEKFTATGTQVIVSSIDAINIANNKSACYTFLQKQGIAVPQFAIADTVQDFEKAFENLYKSGKTICFKPSISNGSRGFRVISNVNEADLLFNHKPYNTHIAYKDAVRILSLKPFPQLLVAEYLPGDEYSVDCLAENGEPKLIIPRLRTKMINGISVKGEIIKEQSIIDYCAAIIKAIGLHGNIGIQVKKSGVGEPLLLEINPRVQGTIVANLGAGVNLPVLAIKQELGLPIAAEEMQVKWGTRFSRYWTEVFIESPC